MKKALVAVVVVAAILAGLFHVLKTREGPIVLAYKFKAGETTRYRAKWTAKGQSPFDPSRPPVQKERQDLTREIVKVNKDGSAQVEASSQSTCFCCCPGHFPYWNGPLRVSKFGRIGGLRRMREVFQYGSPETTSDRLTALMSGMGAVLPSHGVGVGQSWSETVPFPMGGGDLTMTGVLVSDRVKLGKRRVCKIENHYEGTLDAGEMHKKSRDYGGNRTPISGTFEIDAKCTLYFSREEGRVIRQDDKIRIVCKQTEGRTPGTGGSSTGASITYQMTAQVDSEMVLVEKPPSP